MYTAVLMMAMTASVDVPEARRGGCGGGCFGGCMGGGRRMRGGGGCCGCYGGGYGGCYGGCYGGGWGGCYGGGCYGGGCYGGGCYGGGCYGGGCYGGGCYGGGVVISGGGCYGGVISGGCYGGGVISGGVIMPGTGTVVPSGEQLKTKPEEKKKNGETMVPAPATIVVDLPADAKVLIDNEATTSTGSSRVFTSPILNPGKEYHYTLKAEIVRDGKTVKAEKVIAVKAGETTPVTLTLPAVGVAQR
jgi:uncharacterized protein (TIGR03000 family)